MKQLFEILPSEWAEKFSKTMKERIELSFTNEDVISLIESKVGGRGYLPKEQGYPVNEGGEPLFFLAQINFAEMPQIENYPKSGILAFYVDYHDDLYGLNFDDQTEQNGFRVFFFENIDRESMTAEEQAVYFEGIDKSALYTVVKGEYKLAGRVTKELLMNDILEFEKEFGSGFYASWSKFLVMMKIKRMSYLTLQHIVVKLVVFRSSPKKIRECVQKIRITTHCCFN